MHPVVAHLGLRYRVHRGGHIQVVVQRFTGLYDHMGGSVIGRLGQRGERLVAELQGKARDRGAADVAGRFRLAVGAHIQRARAGVDLAASGHAGCIAGAVDRVGVDTADRQCAHDQRNAVRGRPGVAGVLIAGIDVDAILSDDRAVVGIDGRQVGAMNIHGIVCKRQSDKRTADIERLGVAHGAYRR